MKKYFTIFMLMAIADIAAAQSEFTLGIGYQTSEIANSDYRDGDPAGLGINLRYALSGDEGMFVEWDLADQEDEADLGGADKLTTAQERSAIGLGYVFDKGDGASLRAAIYSVNTEWSWEDGNAANFNRFDSDDSGISIVIGADKNLGSGVSFGTALSLGFEMGVEAYASIDMSDELAVKMGFYKSSYELAFEEFDELGPVGTGTAFGDGEYQFDATGFRISVNYSF